MVWSTIPSHPIILAPPCCLLLATDTSKLDKISSSIRSIKYHSRFICENYLKETIFMYFSDQFWRFKVFVLVSFFKNKSQFTKYSTFYVFLDCQFKTFQRSEHGCFVITCFSLYSSRGSKFLQLFLYFESSTSLSFNDLCKDPLIFPKWTFPLSITFILFFSS